jgi:hypothetical protein
MGISGDRQPREIDPQKRTVCIQAPFCPQLICRVSQNATFGRPGNLLPM